MTPEWILRRNAADAAFEAYEMGEYAVADASGWEQGRSGTDVWVRAVLFLPAGESRHALGGIPGTVGHFTVEFVGTDTVVSAVASIGGDDVGTVFASTSPKPRV